MLIRTLNPPEAAAPSTAHTLTTASREEEMAGTALGMAPTLQDQFDEELAGPVTSAIN